MRYIASCSFGKDSLAMLLLLIEKEYPLDEVIFHDSGCEFQAVYNLIEKVKPLLEAKGVKLTILKMRKTFEYMCFEHPIPEKKSGKIHKHGYGWCGGNCHWITAYKIRDIQRYMKDYGEYREYVGICYDEPERWDKCDRKERLLPLVDFKMTQADCLKFCYDRGYTWTEDAGAGEIDLYKDLVDRVSCWCCRNKNLKELKNYFEKAPKYWNALVEMEKRIGEPMKKPRMLTEIEVFFRAGVENKRKYNELMRKNIKGQISLFEG